MDHDKIKSALPIVHMNGDTPETLVGQREEVFEALDNVLYVMKKMAPNGRNFYPEPGRMQKAEEMAAKIGTKLIFPLVLCLFPSFFTVAIGPAILAFIKVFAQL